MATALINTTPTAMGNTDIFISRHGDLNERPPVRKCLSIADMIIAAPTTCNAATKITGQTNCHESPNRIQKVSPARLYGLKSNAATKDTSQYGVYKKHAATEGINIATTGNKKFFFKYENVIFKYFTYLLYRFTEEKATLFIILNF